MSLNKNKDVKYLQLLRCKQWAKNLFVFVAVFFSGQFLQIDLLVKSFLAFIIFSLVSSAVYILNDFLDRSSDALHPEKKHRPLASKSISIPVAFLIKGILMLVAAGLIFYLDNINVAYSVTIYYILNVLYCIWLKHVALLDIFIIAFGFVLRVLVGAYATDLYLTDWALILNFILALILAIGKRRGELNNSNIKGITRKSLTHYSVPFLDILLAICCVMAIVCYIMFTLSDQVQQRFHHNIIFTVLFVIFGIFRYLQLSLVYNRSEAPTKILYKDRYIQITLLLWIISFFLLIYYK